MRNPFMINMSSMRLKPFKDTRVLTLTALLTGPHNSTWAVLCYAKQGELPAKEDPLIRQDCEAQLFGPKVTGKIKPHLLGLLATVSRCRLLVRDSMQEGCKKAIKAYDLQVLLRLLPVVLSLSLAVRDRYGGQFLASLLETNLSPLALPYKNTSWETFWHLQARLPTGLESFSPWEHLTVPNQANGSTDVTHTSRRKEKRETVTINQMDIHAGFVLVQFHPVVPLRDRPPLHPLPVPLKLQDRNQPVSAAKRLPPFPKNWIQTRLSDLDELPLNVEQGCPYIPAVWGEGDDQGQTVETASASSVVKKQKGDKRNINPNLWPVFVPGRLSFYKLRFALQNEVRNVYYYTHAHMKPFAALDVLEKAAVEAERAKARQEALQNNTVSPQDTLNGNKTQTELLDKGLPPQPQATEQPPARQPETGKGNLVGVPDNQTAAFNPISSGVDPFKGRVMSGYEFPDMSLVEVFGIRVRTCYQNTLLNLNESTPIPNRIQLPPTFLATPRYGVSAERTRWFKPNRPKAVEGKTLAALEPLLNPPSVEGLRSKTQAAKQPNREKPKQPIASVVLRVPYLTKQQNLDSGCGEVSGAGGGSEHPSPGLNSHPSRARPVNRVKSLKLEKQPLILTYDSPAPTIEHHLEADQAGVPDSPMTNVAYAGFAVLPDSETSDLSVSNLRSRAHLRREAFYKNPLKDTKEHFFDTKGYFEFLHRPKTAVVARRSEVYPGALCENAGLTGSDLALYKLYGTAVRGQRVNLANASGLSGAQLEPLAFTASPPCITKEEARFKGLNSLGYRSNQTSHSPSQGSVSHGKGNSPGERNLQLEVAEITELLVGQRDNAAEEDLEEVVKEPWTRLHRPIAGLAGNNSGWHKTSQGLGGQDKAGQPKADLALPGQTVDAQERASRSGGRVTRETAARIVVWNKPRVKPLGRVRDPGKAVLERNSNREAPVIKCGRTSCVPLLQGHEWDAIVTELTGLAEQATAGGELNVTLDLPGFKIMVPMLLRGVPLKGPLFTPLVGLDYRPLLSRPGSLARSGGRDRFRQGSRLTTHQPPFGTSAAPRVKYHYPPHRQARLDPQTSTFSGAYKRRRATYPAGQCVGRVKRPLARFKHKRYEPLSATSPLSLGLAVAFLFVGQAGKFLVLACGKEIVSPVFDKLVLFGICDPSSRESFGLHDLEKLYRVIAPEAVSKRFKDIAGVDSMMPQLTDLALFLRNSARPLRAPADTPKGILLVGPPGTGKSLLVKAIAGEAQVPMVIQDGSLLVEPGNDERSGNRLRVLFETARWNAPCILFIDEFDTLGPSRKLVMRAAAAKDQPQIDGSALLHRQAPGLAGLLTGGAAKQGRAGLVQKLATARFARFAARGLESVQLGRVTTQLEAKRADLSLAQGTTPALFNPPKRGRKSVVQGLISDRFNTFATRTPFTPQGHRGGRYNKPLAAKRSFFKGGQHAAEMPEKRLGLLVRLLMELDGLKPRHKVLVIGATNRPQALDPALIRPGRMNRVVKLQSPEKGKRVEILKFYGRGIGFERDLSWGYLSDRTAGFSGADLAAAMNKSLIRSVSSKTGHTLQSIEQGIDSVTDDCSEGGKVKQRAAVRTFGFYQAGKATLFQLLSIRFQAQKVWFTDGKGETRFTRPNTAFRATKSQEGAHNNPPLAMRSLPKGLPAVLVGAAALGPEGLPAGVEGVAGTTRKKRFDSFPPSELMSAFGRAGTSNTFRPFGPAQSNLLLDRSRRARPAKGVAVPWPKSGGVGIQLKADQGLEFVPHVLNLYPRSHNTRRKSFTPRIYQRLELETYLTSLYAGKAAELLAVPRPVAARWAQTKLEPLPTVSTQNVGSQGLNQGWQGLQEPSQSQELNPNPVPPAPTGLPAGNREGNGGWGALQSSTVQSLDQLGLVVGLLAVNGQADPSQNIVSAMKACTLAQNLLQTNIGLKDLSVATSLAFSMADRWFLYSGTSLQRNAPLGRLVSKVSDNARNRKVLVAALNDYLKRLAYQNSTQTRYGRFNKLTTGQAVSFRSWWQTQACVPCSGWQPSQRTNSANPRGRRLLQRDWSRFFLPNPLQNKLSGEWRRPDKFYNTDETLRSVLFYSSTRTNIGKGVCATTRFGQPEGSRKHKLYVNWNDLYRLDRDCIAQGLVLTCFNKAFSVLDWNRETLDYFADYLVRFETLRQEGLFDLFALFGYNLSQACLAQLMAANETRCDQEKVVRDLFAASPLPNLEGKGKGKGEGGGG